MTGDHIDIDDAFGTTCIKAYHGHKDLSGRGILIKNTKKYVLQQYDWLEKKLKINRSIITHYEEISRFQKQIKVHYKVDEVIIRGRF